ncbi:MAG TPA: glycosyltransferase family 4 protein [Pirellulales bacterium]|nr:glycosyltransferase family 4 protein [Pirellulales bacterium]
MTCRVCFYRTNVAALLSGTPVCAMGGADLRAWEFARRLAKSDDFHVTFVVGDFGQAAVDELDGVAIRVWSEPWRRRVHAAYRQYRAARTQLGNTPLHVSAFELSKSLPWLVADRLWRGVHNSQAEQNFARLLSDNTPDVVVCFGATPDSADLIATCRRAGIPTVLCITGDAQILGDLGTDNFDAPLDVGRSRRVLASLKSATEIIAQSETQQSLMRSRCNRAVRLIRNPVLPVEGSLAIGDPAVLWVGRAELVQKRPDRLWEVATRCPDIPFRVILNPDAPGVWERLKAEKPANIDLVARVPPAEMGAYFRSARLLANTSARLPDGASMEGFPNAFLQAASLGVPVVSWEVDPDGFLSRHGCGVECGGDAEKMAAEVRRLWHDDGERAAIGRRACDYVASYHDPERCGQQFADVLRLLTGEAASYVAKA